MQLSGSKVAGLSALALVTVMSGWSFGTPRLPVMIDEFASPAPNVFGSPSFAGWTANAINALENGLSSVGNPATDPTAYYQVTTGTDTSNIVTGFPSWNGLANPTGAFASELGNRLHFGIDVKGNGVPISLSELTFDMESTDSGNTFQFTGDFSDPTDPSNVYSPTRIGIIHGISGDTIVNSGPATQVVDEIVYVGVGNAIAPSDIGSTHTGQAAIDDVTAYYDSIMPFSITTGYSMVDGTGGTLATSSATVLFTPEPTSLALLGVGALLLGKRRR